MAMPIILIQLTIFSIQYEICFTFTNHRFMRMENTITLHQFNQLSVNTLYQILKLRAAVFVVEQTCVYQDLDDKDQASLHVCLWDKKQLIAYSRLLPAGMTFEVPAIGRVITHPSYRGEGLGKKLMEYSLQACYTHFGPHDVRLNAQVQVRSFYENLGFHACGAIFLEDDIEHIEMVKPYIN